MKRLMKSISVFFIAVFFVLAAGNAAEAKAGNLSGAVRDRDHLCVYKGEIYYSIYNRLYKLNPSTKRVKLVKKFSKAFSISSFTISGGKMYLTIDFCMGTGGDDCSIYSMDMKTKKLKKLAKGRSCLLKGNYIYYIQTKPGEFSDEMIGIGRVKKNGSGKKSLYSCKSHELAVYKNRLYFYYYDEGYKIKSSKLNGKGVRTEASRTGPFGMRFLGIENNYLYYAEGDPYRNSDNIYRQKIGSSRKTLLISGIGHSDIYNNVLYYVKTQGELNTEKSSVYKMNLKNKKTTKIYTCSKGIHDIQCCGRWLYLTVHLGVNKSKNMQDVVITTSGKKVKNLQKYFKS